MIEHVEIENFKCIKKVSVDLGMFNVLIGPNDSGKSAFLQAVSLPIKRAREGAEVPEATRIVARWPDAFLALQNNHLSSVVGLDRAFVQRHDVSAPLRFDPDAVLASSSANERALAAIVQNRGRGTTAQLAQLALGDRDRFEAIRSGLHRATNGRVREVSIQDNGAGQYSLHFRLHDGTLVDGREVSQGIVLLTAFLALVHREDTPRTLLIEEPENGIHPRRVHEVLQLLRTLNERGVQILLTTHSPDLLSACKPEEVLVFRRPDRDSPTEIHRLPPDMERRLVRESLGELWAATGEEGLLDLPREIRVAGGGELRAHGAGEQ
ncbi:MAG: AAA family ATPase [Polyangiales bacterium]